MGLRKPRGLCRWFRVVCEKVRQGQPFFPSFVIGINYYAVKSNSILFILTAVVYLFSSQELKADHIGLKSGSVELTADNGFNKVGNSLENTSFLDNISLSLGKSDTLPGDRSVTIVNYDQLANVFTKNDNVLYVVNFWATWCTPCVKELPDFMEVNAEFKNRENFKMILVSLDDSEAVDGSVKKIITEKKLDTKHYLLDDIKRMNEWIPAVDSGWSGSIPATLFIKNGKKLRFIPASLEKEELREIILDFITKH